MFPVSSRSETNSELSSSSSSSSVEDLMALVILLPRPKIYRERNNPFEMYDEVDFEMRYRFSKDTVRNFIEIFELDELTPINNRNFPISTFNQLFITLRYYATGSFQTCIGDHINVNKSTVGRILTRITRKIAAQAKYFIRMPSMPETINATIAEFYAIQKFPKIIGAIDCTHIRIRSPGGENAEIYRNRKGWFSINVQAVCNARLQITDIVARWPGSVHDSTIFNSSSLRAKFEAGEFPHALLLGDNGYASKSYLLTPYLNPATPAEMKYNGVHIKTRNTIERTFGVWKRRFPCLTIGMNVKPEQVVEIIVATAVLHNIAITMTDDLPNFDEEVPVQNIEAEAVLDNSIPIRTVLTNTVFAE